MIELKIFNEPTAERITEMIETIEDIRDADISWLEFNLDCVKTGAKSKKVF